MLNHTPVRTCRVCGIEKPLSEFYKHETCKQGHLYTCKECFKQKQRGKKGAPKNTTAVLSQSRLIDEMRRQGIYATTGKCSEWRYCDVVAWGCVRIESKTLFEHRMGEYAFNLSASQQKGQIVGDFIVLIWNQKTGTTYHVFPVNHPVFFMDGRRKKAVGLDLYASHHKRTNGTRLTAALMAQYRDRWDLIEAKRLEIQAKLLGESPSEPELSPQLSLF